MYPAGSWVRVAVEEEVASCPGDVAGQTDYVLGRIEAALVEAGATLADVVRTRIVVRNLEDADDVARHHGEVFAQVRPANTLLRGEPVDPQMLVKIEAAHRARQQLGQTSPRADGHRALSISRPS